MKKAWLDPRRKSRLSLQIVRVALAAALLSGCKAVPHLPPAVQDFGPSYHPTNIYRRSPALPAEVRRVALLPLTTSGTGSYLDSGVETLAPLVFAELEKTKRFEIIPVTGRQMQEWTGQTGWRVEDQLPHDLFEKLKAATGCDAVLFCQLTRYQPYQPLAVGWKFALVQIGNSAASPAEPATRTLWAADEVLDAGDPPVATGARAYYSEHMRNDAASADAAVMLNSPSRFGQYTLATLLATLPERAGVRH